MLRYCRFKWHPKTSLEQVRKRVIEQDKAGTNQPEKIKGWYNLAGGGAGFMLVEAEERDLTHLLQPYMDLVSWNVHAVYELDYDKTIASLIKG
ncbi:MAG: DUF3303 domain-containing protein [Gaiellaceae bacterium]